MATWYVRPDTSHGGTNAGTSYADAWQGWAQVVWGVSGVAGGDTLYVCGTHAYASTISVGAHAGAAEGTRCTVTGNYAADPGSITFTGAVFLQNTRAWTTVDSLTIVAGSSNCMYITAAATDSIYSNNTFTSSAASAFSINSATGQAHSNVTITGNTFLGASSNSGSGAALSWFVTATSAVSTLTSVTISDNTFTFDAGRAVIHFRTEDDTDASSVMTGIVISGNRFTNCTGVLCDIEHGHATANIGGTLRCFNNIARDCGESLVSAGTGGMFFLRGFSDGRIYSNKAYSVVGSVGFCNVFYGSYRVYDNLAEDLSTTTIDGNGVLFDHGADRCLAKDNTFRRVTGKTGTANSGVGVMVLDATNITVQGNVTDGCRWGVYIGTATPGQSCKIIANTFANATEGGIYANASSDLANCEIKDNIFAGEGYSVYDLSAATWTAETHNCFYGFSDGASAHTLGTGTITTDPQLGSDYRISSTSPCKGAGTYIRGAKHFGGQSMSVSAPDIGAYRYFATRAVTSR